MTNIPTGVPREIICADKHFYAPPKSAIKKRERNVFSRLDGRADEHERTASDTPETVLWA